MLLAFIPLAIGAGVWAANGPDPFDTTASWPFWLLVAAAVACIEIGHRSGWTHR